MPVGTPADSAHSPTETAADTAHVHGGQIERLLDPDEVAKLGGFTRRYLEMLVKDGTAPPSFKIGKLRRFPESGYRRWIAEKLAGTQRSVAA